MISRKVIAVLFTIWLCSSAYGDLSLYPLFTSNAVLQRDVPLKIWGAGDDGEAVTVMLAGQTAETVVTNGCWSVTLKPIPAGGPYELDVRSGSQKQVCSNVLLGDVWLCGGQSNMAVPIRYFLDRLGRPEEKMNFYKKLFAGMPESCSNNNIRFIRLMPTVRQHPIDTPVRAFQWQKCEPQSVRELSAAAYFFARKLQPEIGVPVGLIVDAVSGTPAQAWVPWSVLDSKPLYAPIRQYYEDQMKTYPEREAEYDRQASEYRKKQGLAPDASINPWAAGAPRIPYGPENNDCPAGLFNGMITPLTGMVFKGVIWYQGESNTQTMEMVNIYRELFPDLIRCWRDYFYAPDLPFLYVQLAGFNSPLSHDSLWPSMRAAQAEVEKTVSHTAMVVAIDGGLQEDIHPPFKKLVGDRLAQAALVTVYGQSGVWGGPRFSKAVFQPDRVVVSFSRIGKGLISRGVELGLCGKYKLAEGDLQGFEIAGSDGIFDPATAVIDGATVIVKNDRIHSPTAVRYAWKDFPLANLYNRDGFPAIPFTASNP